MSDTRSSLLAAARVELAEHGLKGSRTKRIAAAAGVSEVTLFRHFPTKRDLFLAVLEGYSSLSVFDEALEGRLTWHLKDDLKMIACLFLAMTDASVLPMLTSIIEAMRDPEVRELVAGPPRRQLNFMTWYLAEQVKRGGCRPLPDVKIAAQAFLALFFEHSIGKAVYVDNPPSPEDAVEQLVELFVAGIAQD